MVKIPGLDDLKKMGSDLIDTAKSVKIGEMVDKLKAGKNAIPQGDEALKAVFQEINNTVTELSQAQTAEVAATKKLVNHLSVLAKILENYQPIAPANPEQPKQEDTKNL